MGNVETIDFKEILELIDNMRDNACKTYSVQKDIQNTFLLGRSCGGCSEFKTSVVGPEFVDYLVNINPKLRGIRLYAYGAINNELDSIKENNNKIGFIPNFTIFMCLASMKNNGDRTKVKKYPEPSKDPNQANALVFICMVKGEEFTTTYPISRDSDDNIILAAEPIGDMSAFFEAMRQK